MATKMWAVGLILLCTLLTTTAQIFLKFGANRLPPLLLDLKLLLGIITDWPLLVGIALYGTGAVIMLIAFKGGDVTVLYPIFASSYIWVSLLSSYFFSDVLSLIKIAGILIIILGISFIAWGSQKNPPQRNVNSGFNEQGLNSTLHNSGFLGHKKARNQISHSSPVLKDGAFWLFSCKKSSAINPVEAS